MNAWHRAEPPAFDPQALTLVGRCVRIEPLALRHADDLFAVGSDEDIWRYLGRPAFGTVADATAWIREALAGELTGEQIPFAVVQSSSGRAVGSTRYLDIRREHRGLEIGWTWLGRAVQRTGINTECKLLLLTHAFETLGAIRVQLKTDRRNERSQRAIERIGAVREGVLRSHMLVSDGHVRDSVYFSITHEEWPEVKKRLLEMQSRASS